MRSGIRLSIETVENGAVVEYETQGGLVSGRKRVFYQFDDLVQFLAEHFGEKVYGRWEPRDPEVSRR